MRENKDELKQWIKVIDLKERGRLFQSVGALNSNGLYVASMKILGIQKEYCLCQSRY